METIKWLQSVTVFSKVALYESYSLAAKELGVSKSFASKTVRELEDTLGAQLLSRSTRKVALTAKGRDFLSRCSSSLGSLEHMRLSARDLTETVHGPLRISVAGIFGERYIAPLTFELSKKYPKLEIELNFESRMVDLIAENYDVAIRIGEMEDSSLFARKIATRMEFVCASKEYLARAGFPESPRDLSAHNCLSVGTREWIFEEKGKKLSVNIAGNFRSNNPRAVLEAALSGVGIVRLPGSYVSGHIQTGELVNLLTEFATAAKDIWVVTPYRKEMNANVKVFIEELELFFAEVSAGLPF